MMKNRIDELNSVAQSFYDKKMLENATRSNVFMGLSDVEVEEVVPRWYVRIPIIYIHKNYDYGFETDWEWVVGIGWKQLFTLGKKKQKRFLHFWELPKNKRKNNVIKFKRYEDLDK